MTLKQQEYFDKKGLSLKEAFIFLFLKKLSRPITYEEILGYVPLAQVNLRQLKNIIKKITDANIMATKSNRNGTVFIFPYFTSATKCTKTVFGKCKKLPQQTIFRGRFLHFTALYKYNKINKKPKVKIRHTVVDHTDDIFVKGNRSQVKYLKLVKDFFKNQFPNKNNYIKSELPQNFNLKLLVSKINESPFLKEREFASLEWCIKHYNAIISGYYRQYEKPVQETAPQNSYKGFQERTYTNEECNSLFDSLDDIEL